MWGKRQPEDQKGTHGIAKPTSQENAEPNIQDCVKNKSGQRAGSGEREQTHLLFPHVQPSAQV